MHPPNGAGERPPTNRPDLDALNLALEGWTAEEILAVAAQRFAPRIGLATGFGREGCVLVEMIARHRLPVDLFTLDTGALFPETHALWKELEARFGITIRSVQPSAEVLAETERGWETDPDRCCQLRKVVPLRAEVARFDAWVTAIRRDQTAERSGARIIEWDDKFGLVKVNPLVAWTEADVDAHVARYDVPVSALHARGYPSVGCQPCTSPVAPGEDPRAGRWRGRAKKECGLHGRPGFTSSPSNTQE